MKVAKLSLYLIIILSSIKVVRFTAADLLDYVFTCSVRHEPDPLRTKIRWAFKVVDALEDKERERSLWFAAPNKDTMNVHLYIVYRVTILFITSSSQRNHNIISIEFLLKFIERGLSIH